MKLVSAGKREVVLLPYDSIWPIEFADEAIKIKKILGENTDSIHHIGSTSIPGMLAKPTIDILVVVKKLAGIEAFNPLFEKSDYQCMGQYGIAGRRYYFKRRAGQHSHHIHLFERGNPEIVRHLGFRDYLCAHPEAALAYANIKCYLQKQFTEDVSSYVQAKDSFIRYIDYQTGCAKADQFNAMDTVILEEYDPRWEQLAAAEIAAILKTVALPYECIEHLGSTAVKALKAKPIIDIFIALKSIEDVSQWVKPLGALGYVYWHDNPDESHHRFFKGMPPYGVKRTHHVHIMPIGKDFDHRVAFRNRLRQDKNIAKRYEELKCQLSKRYERDREGYTEAKTGFIEDALNAKQGCN